MLLILAGVALATLTGQGNIIGNAENAVGKYNNSVADEQQFLNEIEKYFQNYLEGGNGDNTTTPPDPVEPPEVNEDGLATENTTIKPDPNSEIQITIPAGFAPAILATGTTQSLPGQDGSVASIMPADEWNNITTEDINKGIVIVDNAITYDNGQLTGTTPDFNEYVWVPIPDFSNDFNVNDWDRNSVVSEPTNDEEKENMYWDDNTSKEYENMLDSVKQHKGFYIGRYEASKGSGGIANSKRNVKPWIEVSQLEAILGCKNSKIESMHLIYGIEWDSTLNWLKDNAIISSSISNDKKILELEDIKENSCSWGNYEDSIGDAKEGCNELQNTGNNESWKANNIYDLAGNLWEWTQENFSIDEVSRRGGNFPASGKGHCVASRESWNADSTHYDCRITL